MSFAQFLAILRARWKVPTYTLLTLVTIALLLGFFLPKKYTAEGSVVVENRSPDPVTGTMAPQTSTYLSTQMDIIRSDRVARMVVKRLKLTDIPTMRENWQEETEGRVDFEGWLAELLLKGLELDPQRNSNVINVAFVGTDPRFAAALANEFIRAYMDVVLELRVSPARQFTSMFNEQLEQARAKLESSQKKLSAFQQAEGIIATDERIDVETARLAELSAQVVAQQSVIADAVSRNAQSGVDSPDSMSNGVIMGLKADLARQEARLEEESARLGENHPAIRQLKAGIAELRQRIRSESTAVGRSSGVSVAIAKQREGQTRALLEAQREKLLQLKSIRDQAALLAKDVESAQRAYDGIITRANQTRLDSQVNQTNVDVLKFASTPANPSSPRKVLYVLQAIFVGLFVGIGLSVVLELRDRRVRVDEDLVELIGMGSLGTMPSASAKSTKVMPVRFAPQLPGKSFLRLPTSSSQS